MLENPHFNSPPPNMALPPPMGGNPNIGLPPPNMAVPPPNMPGHPGHPGHHFNRYNSGGPPAGIPQTGGPRGHQQFFQPFRPYPRPTLDPEFDGKRLRKSVMRKTVDYNAAIIKLLESRVWQRDFRDRRALQPDVLYYPDLQPPRSYEDNPMNAVTTRFVKTATNKMRCPVFCMAWTPEGRRLVTGASSGEFTLWNGLTFNFETILQAHDSPVRTMVWSHNEQWMVTADHAGYVKYWQSNMNNVKMFQGHKEAVRGISFSPSDSKFATCSDDGTIRVWDFLRCHEERILRGHGADVKCVDWHPQKGLIVSGSKDNQQPVKLWDPKSGQSLATLHAHKSTVMDVKWNSNGNWLVTASRDHLLKLFDIRQLGQELQTFRGHKKESSSVAWHPYHEGLFASGGSDGAILFWHVGADKEVGAIEQAHDSIVWTLAWHPLGHILCSGSNDHTSKFWTRNRPGDQMRDKYNLNNMPAGVGGLEEMEQDDSAAIPGMGPEDRVENTQDLPDLSVSTSSMEGAIPGLDFDMDDKNCKQPLMKKVPYSKPIPRNFQAQWNDTARPNIDDENGDDDLNGENREADQDAIAKMIQQIVEKVPGVVPVSDLEPTALFMYGKVLPVTPESVLARTIGSGADAIYRLINCGAVEDLVNDIAHDESTQYYHEDPTVDTELRSLKAYELPRRPPLLSTPNIPPQKLPDRGRSRGRTRDRDPRGRSREREENDDDYRDNQGMDYNDQEDEYYQGYDEDDSDAIHQRFMSEEEEIYNSQLVEQDVNHGFADQDMREQRMSGRDFSDKDMRASGNGDQDLRQPLQAGPGPSLLGIAPGIPGSLGRAGPAAFMKDHDLRRSGPLIQDRDPRDPRKQLGAGAGAAAAGLVEGAEDDHGEDRDYRRSGSGRPGLGPGPGHGAGRAPLLAHGHGGLLGKFPAPGQFGFGQDGDFRPSPGEDGGRPGRGKPYRSKDDYEEGEDADNAEEEGPYGRHGPAAARGGYGGMSRWGSGAPGGGGGDGGEDDYEDAGRWGQGGSRGRGAAARAMRGSWGPMASSMAGGPGPGPGRGPGPGPQAKGGLLETPKGGLLATPSMLPMHDDTAGAQDDDYRGKRRHWDGEGDGQYEDGDDVDGGGGHRGGYRGRGRGGGGWGGYSSSSRGSWGSPGSGGPMRGRGRGGRAGGPPRGGRRGRGRN